MYASDTYDWPMIRALYEKGVKVAQIPKQVSASPTRQAIAQRAKREGWKVALVSREDLPPALTQSFGRDTPETRAQVIDAIRNGVSESVAASLVGVHRNTLGNWKKQDVAFCAAIDSARAAFINRHHANIDKAGERDWRASAYVLERQAETREQFNPANAGSGGISIVLNIVRDVEGPDSLERDSILSTAEVVK